MIGERNVDNSPRHHW